MRKSGFIAASLGAIALALTAGASNAQTDYHHHHHRHHRHYQRNYRCEEDRRHAANNGTIVGALGGALAGNVLSHGGGKTGGTLIGAGVGAVAGHQIAKNNHRC